MRAARALVVGVATRRTRVVGEQVDGHRRLSREVRPADPAHSTSSGPWAARSSSSGARERRGASARERGDQRVDRPGGARCIITMDHGGAAVQRRARPSATPETTSSGAAAAVIPPVRDSAPERPPAIGRRGGSSIAAEPDGAADGTVSGRADRHPPRPARAPGLRGVHSRHHRPPACGGRSGSAARSRQAARVRAEEAERFERTVAETLQHGLLPPELPAVPGIGLGAALPGGRRRHDVGGDFYDVFELSEDRGASRSGTLRQGRRGRVRHGDLGGRPGRPDRGIKEPRARRSTPSC